MKTRIENLLTISAEAQHHGILAADLIAEIGADEDTGEGDGAEEELVFACFDDVGVLDNGGDDDAGEDAVGERDLAFILEQRISPLGAGKLTKS